MTPTTSPDTGDVQAHLADGTILHFPAGTDPSVVQGVVKQRISNPSPPPGTPPISAAPVPRELQKNPPNPTYLEGVGERAGKLNDLIDKGVDLAKNSVRPMVAGTMAGEGAAAGAELGSLAGPVGTAVGGLAGGIAGYTITDQALARAKNLIKQTPGENPSTEQSLKDAALNWAGGKLIGAGVKVVKGAVAAGQQGIADLQGTVSQYLESIGQDSSKSAAVRWLANATKGSAKMVEDLGSPASKTAAIQRSGGLGTQQMEGQVKDLTGGTVDPNEIADQYQTIAGLQRSGSLAESNKQALAARMVAKSNTLTIPGKLDPEDIAQQVFGNSFKNLHPNIQNDIYNIAAKAGLKPPPDVVIEGPINGTNSIPQASQIVQDHLNALSKDPAMAPVVNVANDIKNEFSNGPVSFGKVWDLKQRLDNASGWAADEVTPAHRAARGLAANLNDDMEQSIANWPNDPQKLGFKAWNLAKATVQQRNLTFNPEGSGVQNVGDLVDKANGILPKMEQTINDPKQLQRALNAGEIEFPSGAMPAPNARGTLQAYKWNSMKDASKSVDAVSGGVKIDAQKMYNEWNDPKFASSRDLLYSNQQDSNWSQFMKNLAMTQQKQIGLGPAAKLWVTARGLALAAPLLTGTLTGHQLAGAAFTSMEIGAIGVSKAMSNPRVARGLIALAAGQPLSMSDQQFSRMLASAIQGAGVTVVGQGGSRTSGTLDKNGKFTAEDPVGGQ